MLWKQAARGDERGYGTWQCVEASSLTTGYLAALRIGTNGSFNGSNVVMADSDNAPDLPGFIGVAAQDIPSNTYGLIQVFGPVASVFISNVGTSLTVNVGDPLVPGKAGGGAFSGAPTYANSGFCFIIASNTPAAISAAGYLSGFIRHGV